MKNEIFRKTELKSILSKRTFYKIAGRCLALAGVMLGFSFSIAAQYGIIHYDRYEFKLMGTVNSYECKDFLPDIKLKLIGTNYDNNVFVIDSFYTNSKGEFSYNKSFFSEDVYLLNNKTIKIIAEDIDGRKNYGKFLTFEKNINFNTEKVNKEEKSYYSTTLLKCEPVKIELKQDGIPYCKKKSQRKVLPKDSLLNIEKKILTTEYSGLTNTNNNKGIHHQDTEDKLLIFPNPNPGLFQFELYNAKPGKATIQILDNSDKLVYRELIYIQAGKFTKTINILELSTGVYFLRISTDRKVFSAKFVKS